MTCNLCYGRGYIYHSDKEEYDVEVCQCQVTEKNETN
jgi:hypothetical protein